MKRVLARVRVAWQALWRGNQLDAEMRDEMRFHVEMETERLMREQKLDAQEARRRAHIAFGGVEKYKDETTLLKQTYIRDESMTVEQLIMQNVAAIGENVIVRRFQRWELGESNVQS